jgi:hypothetical protein
LIPKPTKTVQLDFAKPLVLTRNYTFPAGRVRFWTDFETALKLRFEVPKPSGAAIAVDGGEARMGFEPGGYKITITPKAISVLGQDDEGIRHGMSRLAQLAFVHNGKLSLPTGYLSDEPRVRWRGVHLFVGPSALEFHKKLWRNVLLPMGFNKVVLQCEQTAWDTLPGTTTPITMSKKDLKALFDWYRSVGVEPIPLIQSFGHMEWFFRNGQNLELAYNREVPYTIDVRKPEAQRKLATLWAEAAELLQPKTVHFGSDEVDMRGFAPGSEALVTEMWKQHMPFLGELAKELKVRMMVWGDNALAPGEAVDATHGVSKAVAEERRRAIPRGTMIADWHYKADPNPAAFYPTLQLWEREGFSPIASTWNRPENIRGFHLAAALERCGTLQTTWAGYESSEAAMLKAQDQFSAMVLAGDYSWSARQDDLDELGYDPKQVFERMYFGKPQPVR